MSGPTLRLGLPPRSIFKFPPDPAPPALPPAAESTFASPFPIDATTYNNALHPALPAAISILYSIFVTYSNAFNSGRGRKPWRISKTKIFFAFVILHNIALALYSGTTFAAMLRALQKTWGGARDFGVVELADSLCKMHGPRGLGDAAYYNATANNWEIKNEAIHLGAHNLPDPTDVGRLWNEGLAFWGWLFYLSKFYEVFDTVIILAKGKRSSTLQTYHHFGAMWCMWAGIRYMSPPIWLFVFLNSGIHTLMYTYYTLSALGIRVPQPIKRTLTTLQITQFIVGASFAGLHLFVSYSVPVSTPYKVITTVTSIVESVASVATSAVSKMTAAATTSAGFSSYLKKLALRAAGEEGLAENVDVQLGIPHPAQEIIKHEVPDLVRKIEKEVHEIRYKNEYETVPCIDTTGQCFAIWLNLMYLAPLTWLFIRFFIRSYSRRTASKAKHPTHRHVLSKAAKDAAHGVDREVDSLGRGLEDSVNTLSDKARNDPRIQGIKEHFENFEHSVLESAKLAVHEGNHTVERVYEIVSEKAELDAEMAKGNLPDAENANEAVEAGNVKAGQVQHTADALLEKQQEYLPEASNSGEEIAEDVMANGEILTQQTKENAQDNAEQAPEDAKEVADQGKEKTEGAALESTRDVQCATKNGEERHEGANGETKDNPEDASEHGAQEPTSYPDALKGKTENAVSQAEGNVGDSAILAGSKFEDLGEAVNRDVEAEPESQKLEGESAPAPTPEPIEGGQEQGTGQAGTERNEDQTSDSDKENQPTTELTVPPTPTTRASRIPISSRSRNPRQGSEQSSTTNSRPSSRQS